MFMLLVGQDSEGDELKIACVKCYGAYKFLAILFRLTNALANFSTLMSKIFCSYLNKFMVVYLDDIVIYNNSMKEYVRHLMIVFQILKENDLYIKRK